MIRRTQRSTRTDTLFPYTTHLRSKQRLEHFPDVPTAQGQGIDLVVNKFRGIAGPKNLTDESYAKGEEGIQSVLKDPEFQEWYRAQSLVPEFMPHEEYAKFIEEFAAEQQDFFKQYGITE